jgi:hypothetical protein
MSDSRQPAYLKEEAEEEEEEEEEEEDFCWPSSPPDLGSDIFPTYKEEEQRI